MASVTLLATALFVTGELTARDHSLEQMESGRINLGAFGILLASFALQDNTVGAILIGATQHQIMVLFQLRLAETIHNLLFQIKLHALLVLVARTNALIVRRVVTQILIALMEPVFLE